MSSDRNRTFSIFLIVTCAALVLISIGAPKKGRGRCTVALSPKSGIQLNFSSPGMSQVDRRSCREITVTFPRMGKQSKFALGASVHGELVEVESLFTLKRKRFARIDGDFPFTFRRVRNGNLVIRSEAPTAVVPQFSLLQYQRGADGEMVLQRQYELQTTLSITASERATLAERSDPTGNSQPPQPTNQPFCRTRTRSVRNALGNLCADGAQVDVEDFTVSVNNISTQQSPILITVLGRCTSQLICRADFPQIGLNSEACPIPFHIEPVGGNADSSRACEPANVLFRAGPEFTPGFFTMEQIFTDENGDYCFLNENYQRECDKSLDQVLTWVEHDSLLPKCRQAYEEMMPPEAGSPNDLCDLEFENRVSTQGGYKPQAFECAAYTFPTCTPAPSVPPTERPTEAAPTHTPTETATITPTYSAPTETPTSGGPTHTPTSTVRPEDTMTPTRTLTATPSSTATTRATPTALATETATSSPTEAPTQAGTAPPVFTTIVPQPTNTPVSTSTSSAVPTHTPTLAPTASTTSTATEIPTPPPTITPVPATPTGGAQATYTPAVNSSWGGAQSSAPWSIGTPSVISSGGTSNSTIATFSSAISDYSSPPIN